MRTIHEALHALDQGELSPIDLVNQCLRHYEREEPRVGAWVFFDAERALEEARLRTEELHRGQRRGPLHGIPIGIKDIFDVRDWPTAAGSTLWANSIARQDAEVVRRLREAGAIFLGKTVTTAYASFDPPVTRNPWNTLLTPGGSSSGSAAALATGMCFGALGSQTGGSINRPASYCGVAGLKPTYGLIPVTGVVPLAPSLDHVGPMARSIHGLAIMLEAMTGTADYVNALSQQSSPKLGRVRGMFEDLAEPAMRDMMDEVHRLLDRPMMVPIAETALPSVFDTVLADHRTVMAVEAAQTHGLRMKHHPADYPAKITGLIEEGLACPEREYRRCLEQQKRLREEMARCLEPLNALIMPATTGPPPPADTTGNPAFNSPWSFIGLPSLSLPTGKFHEGLPLCIQLVGGWGREAELLAAAYWCEQVLAVKPLDPWMDE